MECAGIKWIKRVKSRDKRVQPDLRMRQCHPVYLFSFFLFYLTCNANLTSDSNFILHCVSLNHICFGFVLGESKKRNEVYEVGFQA